MRIVKVTGEFLEGVYWGPKGKIMVDPPSPERPYWTVHIRYSDGNEEVIMTDGKVTVCEREVREREGKAECWKKWRGYGCAVGLE